MRATSLYLAIVLTAAWPAFLHAQQPLPGAEVRPPGADDPVTVADFVKRCSNAAANSGDGPRCRDIITFNVLMQKREDAKNFCPSSDPAKSRSILDAVARWLTPRADLRDREKEWGISIALEALYPCPKH